MSLDKAARSFVGELSDLGLAYALVGGLAVSARADPRFTQDIDLVVAVDSDAIAEETVHHLLGRGYRTLAVIEQEAKNRVATVRFALPGEAWEGDLLFASSGIEPEIVAAAESFEIVPGLRLPVASIGHLIALKLLARDDDSRPQDVSDLHALIGVATEADLAAAGEAVDLITTRSYARGRDLRADLTAIVATFG